MFRIHLINSKENEIRIFYYNHYLQNSAINDIYCPKNEIHEISIQLQNSISEINKNLHNRVQLFEQFKNQAQSLFMLCISDFIEVSNINEHENLIIQFEYDEDLGFIPFEFLFNGEYFLSEKFQINRKINGNSIKHEIPKESKFCLLGNFSDDFDIRKSVDNELIDIANIFDKNNIQYNGPNVGPISDKSEIQNYFSYSNFIHFSGHFSNSKNKSGWKLNSESVFNLEDFKSLSHIPHFLFSNSCGNPSIDSSLNFFHELNKIGVENIIYSTGEINTEFSKQFSVLFYEGIGEGKNISESLLNAKKKFIEKHGYSNPCWLQYNIIGNGNFSLKNENTKINSKPLIGILFSLILITILSLSFI